MTTQYCSVWAMEIPTAAIDVTVEGDLVFKER